MEAPANNNAAPVAPETAFPSNEFPSAYADGRQVVKNISWLKSQPRFLCWSLIPQPDGTVKKIPYNPTTGRNAECNNPETWVDFETAKAAVQAGQYHSIGIALGKDLGLTIVDFDKVIAKPGDPWPQWVLDIVEDLDSYTEISASGRGMHVLAWGAVPSNLNRQKLQIEIHDNTKMFAISANIFDGRSEVFARPEKLQTLHQRILEGKVGPEYKRLIITQSGLTLEDLERGEDAGDASKSDFDYCCRLAKQGLTDEQIDERFRASGRMRDKWEREDYRKRTLEAVRKDADVIHALASKVDFKVTGAQVDGGDYDFVLNPLEGQCDGWFPRGDISLVAASSGDGKTTFMADLLEKQLRGETVFGHTTNQWPYLVVMEDRGARSLRRTLNRMHIDPQHFPHARLTGGLAEGIQRAIMAERIMPAVVFLEGIDLLNDASDGRNVSADLKLLQKVAEHYHVAIIGSTGSPKQKSKDRYIGLRDQVIGTSVWGRKTETIVVLQKENGKETDDVTIMTVLPRNDKPEVFNLVWDRGRFRALRPEEIQQQEEKTASDDLIQWVLGREAFTRAEARKAFGSMSGKTFSDRLEALIKCQAIKRHTKGARVFYSVPSVAEVAT